MDIRIEYHSPDQVFAAVFMRDGEPWYLNGALVGIHSTVARAVLDLISLAVLLVLEGGNFLTQTEWPEGIPLADRNWLYSQIERVATWEAQDAMYVALRQAQDNQPT